MTKTRYQKPTLYRQAQHAAENSRSDVNISEKLQHLSDIFSEKISELSLRIVELEKTIQKNGKSQGKTVTEAFTQTDTTMYSFADALKNGVSKSQQAANHSVKKTNNDRTANPIGMDKKSNGNKSSDSEKKTGSSPSSPSDRKTEVSKNRASKNDLPKTVIVHDSVLSGIETDRLGLSYGLEVKASRAYRVEEMEKVLDSTPPNEPQPEAILIHCGINNLKEKDATTTAKSMLATVQNIQKKHPNSKIVLSKIAPTRDPKLEVKRNLFNAQITAELFESKSITTVSHENLMTNKNYMHDTIHPNRRGTSVLAGNIGRALRDLFWQRPRRPKRPYPQHQPRGMHHPSVYKGFQDSQDMWSSPYVLFNY